MYGVMLFGSRFIFDGFGRNLEEDMGENRVSNIGKLFLAHELDLPNTPSDDFNAYRKTYLSGLGADFDASLGIQVGGNLNRAVSEVTDIPGDIAGDQALKGARDDLAGRSWRTLASGKSSFIRASLSRHPG